jgi:hypothetical protein
MMLRYLQVLVWPAVFVANVPVVEGQEPPMKKAKVEFRWVESRSIEGLTEKEGFQSTCDPDSTVYPHKKAALVLTAAEVDEARLIKHDFSGSGGPRELYSITIHLTKAARVKLAESCEGDKKREVTVFVDGKHSRGVHRYEKDKGKPLIADEVRAETFAPTLAYFSSKVEAERIVDALK